MYAIRFYSLSEVAYKFFLRVWQIPINLHIVHKHKHTYLLSSQFNKCILAHSLFTAMEWEYK